MYTENWTGNKLSKGMLWVVRLQLIFYAVLCCSLYAAFIGF